MAVIEFSFDNLLYVFLYALSNIGQMQCRYFTQIYPQMIFIFLDSISLLLIVIIENISIKINKSNISLSKHNSQERAMFFRRKVITMLQVTDAEKRKSDYLIMLYSTALSVLTSFISSMSYIIFRMLVAGYSGSYFVFNLLFTWLLLWLWSNRKIFRHHVFALSLMLIGLIMAILINLDNFHNFYILFDKQYWKLGLTLIGVILSISTREVIEKYALDILYITHYRLLFYEGIGSFCFNCLLFGILQLIPCKPYNSFISLKSFCMFSKFKQLKPFALFFFNYSSTAALWGWLFCLFTASMNIFRILISKRNGPTHRYSGDIISFIIFIMINIILSYVQKEEQMFTFYEFVTMIVLFIGCMIYNENIRFNVCNIANNTRFEIQNRAALDAIIDENNLSFDSNNWFEK